MIPSLTVNRRELVEGLKVLSKFVKPAQRAEAVLSFDDSALTIDLGGLTIKAAAEGTWPGEARVAGRSLPAIAKNLPPTDPLSIRVEQDRLFVAVYSASCVWQEAGEAIIRLPINATLPMILRLRLNHRDEEIARSGLTKIVQAAEVRRDALIARAAAVLEPLGVQAIDLRQLVDERLRGRNEL